MGTKIKLFKRLILYVAIFLFAITSVPVNGAILVQSTFDTDADGWTVTGDATGPNWQASGGNPGGYIQATDTGQGLVSYWNAPAKFLGNQSAANRLSFDLWQTPTTNQFNSPDVILIGGGITLQLNINHPSNTWTSYPVALTPAAGWWNQTANAPATQANIQTVLSSLTSLQIRAEYSGDLDTDGLDNVILSSVSSTPTSVPTMSEWGMIIFMVLAATGSVYYLKRQRRA